VVLRNTLAKVKEWWGRRPLLFQAPTSLGVAALVMAAIAWLIGWWFGWREFMYISAGSLAVMGVAVAFTFGRMDLDVQLDLRPLRATVGHKVVAEVSLRNRSGHRMLPVRLEVPIGANHANIDVPSLRSEEEWGQEIVMPTSRRAVYEVGPVASVRSDPLNLLRREIRWTEPVELFVHPETVHLSRLSAGWLRDLEGESTEDISESDLNFHALRNYVYGDDRRRIHWRSSAKRMALQRSRSNGNGDRKIPDWVVRQFVDTRRSHLAILLSTNPAEYADIEEFELAVSIAASLGQRAFSSGQHVTFIGGELRTPTPTGQSFMDNCSRVELGDSTQTISDIAINAKHKVSQASVLVLISGSAVDQATLHLASESANREAKAIGVRTDIAGQARFLDSGTTVMVEAASLNDFAQVMWTVNR
jgi:uncharacterized protein (DUF58 family)